MLENHGICNDQSCRPGKQTIYFQDGSKILRPATFWFRY